MKNPGPKIWWSVALTIVIAILIFLSERYVGLPRWLAWSASASIVTALAFFVDKSRASKQSSEEGIPTTGKGRIPEVTLLWLCFIGGTIGGIAVMLWRRHKTRDRKFLMGLIGIIIFQALVLGFLVARNFYGDAPG